MSDIDDGVSMCLSFVLEDVYAFFLFFSPFFFFFLLSTFRRRPIHIIYALSHHDVL